ncbi:MAG: peptidoglycan DD-metalloendopeptidase family protein, partial [Clostridia bacterium]|nr:peptidoglycan DD-metalloendopeptidase family protein [Clostridia bacterium]
CARSGYRRERRRIAEQEQAIADREAAINDRFGTLKERLQAVSKTGNLSVLQMLFNTDSYLDYLLKSKLMQCISAHDQGLIKEMEAEIEGLNEQKAQYEKDKEQLDGQREELEAVKAEADAAKEELEDLYAEVQEVMYDLQADIDYHDEQIALTEEQEAALEAEIERILAENYGLNGSAYLGGSMYWPSTSCTLITDVFGWRVLSGADNFHKGIDIACPGSAYGKDIIAAADGIVMEANSSDEWGFGYGYYVMVDHGIDDAGQQIVTLYAHCSSVYVSKGQEVIGGETQLGAIGNTGWSYGSHLHFEVRVDGSPVNPLGGYVSPP